MRANGRMTNTTDKAHIFGLMVVVMRVNGRIDNVMVKARSPSQMAIVMRVNTKTTNSMDKAHIYGLMVTAIKANGRTTNAMVKARCTTRMVHRNPVVGTWESLSGNNKIHSLIEGTSDCCALYSQPYMLEERIDVAVRKT